MPTDRHLDWQGCFNVRELGGLPAAGGRRTRRGAVVRADAIDRLTDSGWAALHDYGVRTIIDLRNDDELRPDLAPRPPDLTTLHLPLDGVDNGDFWDQWARRAPPLFYGPHLDRFPELSAGVLTAIAGAPPGGVLVHCVAGRDRTGLISMLLLALAGVAPEVIAEDHGLSGDRLRRLYTAAGEQDQGSFLDELLAGEGTSAREVLLATLATRDVEAALRRGGLEDRTLAALRARLLE